MHPHTRRSSPAAITHSSTTAALERQRHPPRRRGATATGLYTVSVLVHGVHGVHDAHDVRDVPESLAPPHPANAALLHFRTEQSDFDSDFGFPEGQSLSLLGSSCFSYVFQVTLQETVMCSMPPFEVLSNFCFPCYEL